MPPNTSLEKIFDSEHPAGVGTYYGFAPKFDEEIIEQTESHVTYLNFEGIVMKERRDVRDASMPQFLKFPVETREDYRKLKWRMELNAEDRFVPDFDEKCENWKTRTDPLCLMGDRQAGFFGPLRNLMGLENLSTTFFDDPAFMEEMLDDRVDLIIQITEYILDRTDIDYFAFWEDMAFRTGPLLSPAMFKKFLVPRYRKVTDYLRSRGVEYIFVDSDGDCRQLVPHWIDGGLSGMWPLERIANMDPIEIRKEFGKEWLIFGGVAKQALAEGPDAIDEEVWRLRPLIEEGGFVPMVDHSCPPDISWEHKCYFMKVLKEVISFE